MSGTYRFVIDVKQRRPACVLLQAAFRGDHHALGRFFDAETRLVAPTDDMRMVSGTAVEWELLAQTWGANGKRRRKLQGHPRGKAPDGNQG